MVFQLHTRGHRPRDPRRGGFTLLEVMMVTAISSFVFAGVLSAYVFLGRGLARQANAESLESRSRVTLFYFTQDLSQATSIIAVNPGVQVTGTLMTLVIPGTGTVTYSCDWSLGSTQGLLQRQVGSGAVQSLLTNLSAFSFGYNDSTGNTYTAPAVAPTGAQIAIKQAYMVYTATAGLASGGAQSNLTVVSPRVVMKNKGLLTDPSDP